MPGSFPIGRLFGIPIRLHYLFFLVLAVQVLGSYYYGPWACLLWFVLLGPVLLVTILIHELGHCLAARSVGGVVEGILLWPLGGLAFIGHTAGPKADVWVAVAGPLTHVPMVAVWLLVLLPVHHATTGSWRISLQVPYPDPPHFGQALCAAAVILNISLAAFNLLVPAYPLDGGRIFVDCLLWRGVSEATTAKVTMALAAPIALGLLVWGCVQFQMVTILVACFIGHSTWTLFQALRSGALRQHPLFAFTAHDGLSGTAGGSGLPQSVGGTSSSNTAARGGPGLIGLMAPPGGAGGSAHASAGPYFKFLPTGTEPSARV